MSRARDEARRCWPSSPSGAKRTCREYRSSGKGLRLPFHRVVDRVHERLRFDGHRLSDGLVEFLGMFRGEEKGSESGLPETAIRREDPDRQIAEAKWPDVGDARQDERRTLDRMNFGKALSGEPGEEVIDGPFNELRIGTVLAAI